jgi:hypothetical protein
VPRFHREFSILAVSHGLPAGSKYLLESRLKQVLVDRRYRNAIHSRTQGLVWNKMVGGVRRRYVDLNGLG